MTTLTIEQLGELTREIAANPERWRDDVVHDPEQRTFALLQENEDVSVWLLCWMPGHDTGFHDHDGSWGAVAVVEGSVREERLTLAGAPYGRDLTPGDGFHFDPTDIHRVCHAGTGPAITIHAYSPPLRGMGAYVQDRSGVLRRELLGSDEELRPLDAAVAG